MRNWLMAGLGLLFLLACQREPQIQVITGYAQGTTYTVKLWAAKTQDWRELKQEIDKELSRIDKLMSNYRQDSDIEAFNQNKSINEVILLDKEILTLLTVSAEVYEKSQHCYDPTIKPLFELWGFADKDFSVPNQAAIHQAKQSIGFSRLQRGVKGIIKTHEKQTIDLSAIGQGYAISKVANVLQDKGITNYLIEIGGEMLVAGQKPKQQKWRVGVERPIPESQKINEVITLSGEQPIAVMTSGTYRNYFDEQGRRYSHILDPRSGRPVEHNSVAVTVLLNDATRADAWSTALLCLGAKDGLVIADKYQIPAVFYQIDGKQVQRLPNKTIQQGSTAWQISKK